MNLVGFIIRIVEFCLQQKQKCIKILNENPQHFIHRAAQVKIHTCSTTTKHEARQNLVDAES